MLTAHVYPPLSVIFLLQMHESLSPHQSATEQQARQGTASGRWRLIACTDAGLAPAVHSEAPPCSQLLTVGNVGTEPYRTSVAVMADICRSSRELCRIAAWCWSAGRASCVSEVWEKYIKRKVSYCLSAAY